jgi:hypothetical protein
MKDLNKDLKHSIFGIRLSKLTGAGRCLLFGDKCFTLLYYADDTIVGLPQKRLTSRDGLRRYE